MTKCLEVYLEVKESFFPKHFSEEQCVFRCTYPQGGVSCYTEKEQRGRSGEEEVEGKVGGEERRNVRQGREGRVTAGKWEPSHKEAERGAAPLERRCV